MLHSRDLSRRRCWRRSASPLVSRPDSISQVSGYPARHRSVLNFRPSSRYPRRHPHRGSKHQSVLASAGDVVGRMVRRSGGSRRLAIPSHKMRLFSHRPGSTVTVRLHLAPLTDPAAAKLAVTTDPDHRLEMRRKLPDPPMQPESTIIQSSRCPEPPRPSPEGDCPYPCRTATLGENGPSPDGFWMSTVPALHHPRLMVPKPFDRSTPGISRMTFLASRSPEPESSSFWKIPAGMPDVCLLPQFPLRAV